MSERVKVASPIRKREEIEREMKMMSLTESQKVTFGLEEHAT